MGKQKPATTVKADAAPIEIKTSKGNKNELAKAERKPGDKRGSPKDGGVTLPKKTQKSEIDDIFSVGKRKAQEAAEAGKRAAAEAVGQEPDAAAAGASAASAKRPRVEGSKDDIFGEAVGKGRKRTEEGYAIYTEDELGLGKKGGNTDLCPFDCDCCF